MHQYFVKPSKDNKQNIFIPIINKCSFILSKKRNLFSQIILTTIRLAAIFHPSSLSLSRPLVNMYSRPRTRKLMSYKCERKWHVGPIVPLCVDFLPSKWNC